MSFNRAVQKQLFLFNLMSSLFKEVEGGECNISCIVNACCKYMTSTNVPSKYFHHNKPFVDKRRVKRFENKIALVSVPATISGVVLPSIVVKLNVDSEDM